MKCWAVIAEQTQGNPLAFAPYLGCIPQCFTVCSLMRHALFSHYWYGTYRVVLNNDSSRLVKLSSIRYLQRQAMACITEQSR